MNFDTLMKFWRFKLFTPDVYFVYISDKMASLISRVANFSNFLCVNTAQLLRTSVIIFPCIFIHAPVIIYSFLLGKQCSQMRSAGEKQLDRLENDEGC